MSRCGEVEDVVVPMATRPIGSIENILPPVEELIKKEGTSVFENISSKGPDFTVPCPQRSGVLSQRTIEQPV